MITTLFYGNSDVGYEVLVYDVVYADLQTGDELIEKSQTFETREEVEAEEKRLAEKHSALMLGDMTPSALRDKDEGGGR